MWHQFDNARTCAEALATDICFLLEKAIIEKGQAVLAVSGGRSPVPVFKELSSRDINWEHVHIILVDERHVPPEHEDSNENLVRQHLLQDHAARASFTRPACQTERMQRAVAHPNTAQPTAAVTYT